MDCGSIWKARGSSTAEQSEPVEIHGLVAYLLQRSEPFEHVAAALRDAVGTPAGTGSRAARNYSRRAAAWPVTRTRTSPTPPPSAIRPNWSWGRTCRAWPASCAETPGRDWLYSWLKQPGRYHPRTLMPDPLLAPIQRKDDKGQIVQVTDPAADLTAYLLSAPQAASPAVPPLDREVLDRLVRESLLDSFPESKADEHLQRGIPQRLRPTLKAAEQELLVSDADFDNPQFRLPAEQKLLYVGRRAMTRYGCSGCHASPGSPTPRRSGPGWRLGAAKTRRSWRSRTSCRT